MYQLRNSVCLTDFSVLALLFNSSPVMSCKTGSTSSSSPSRFLSSLRRWMTNPPRLYIIAWSTWKMSPQTQTEGVSGTSQSYPSFTASRNSLSFKSKSLSLIGKTVSQLNAPFWVAIKSHSSHLIKLFLRILILHLAHGLLYSAFYVVIRRFMYLRRTRE